MDPDATSPTPRKASDEARAILAAGGDVPRAHVADLVAEVDSLRDQLTLSATFEQGYVDEIQRMNALVLELAEYVETVADAVSDSLGSDEITGQLRRQVVKLILQSAQAMRTSEKH